MMDYTDLHCRFFMRMLSPSVHLYTEMVTAHAVIQGDRERLLGFDPAELPLALQLGGSDPQVLARAAAVATQYQYDEINLNVGCPSDRVQTGRFGACLMAEPARVADCIHAMQEATSLPITVKTRIGIDDHDEYEFLTTFISAAAAAGCRHFIVHARKAILAGLSPKENRSVPPLRYDIVYRLKRDFPELRIVLNGGVQTVEDVREHLANVDGVMIGRKAYADPYFLARLQAEFMSSPGETDWRAPTRAEVIERMAGYTENQLRRGVRLHHITRHMLGMYSGLPGARRWRRYISERAVKPGAGPEVLIDSLSIVETMA
jgi:tRNA-dihydrouridine synthase A